MPLIPLILLAICAACAAAFLAIGVTAEGPARPADRLRRLGDTPTFGTPLRSTKATDVPFSDRVIRPILRSVATTAERLGLAGDARLVQEKLDLAGHPQMFGMSIGAREYLAFKLMCLVTAAIALVVLLRHPLMDGTAGIAATGFIVLVIGMLPTLVVDRMVDARKHAVSREMSDTLDLLVVSAEAGLSLDAAMGRVAQKRRGPLADEFEVALQEMRLGRSRADALRGIARRTGVQEVKMFTSAIIQAENLGVSIAQVLRTQADTHRERRSQKVREQAAKLPVKLMFPLIFCILPAIFIVLAAPGVMALMKAFAR